MKKIFKEFIPLYVPLAVVVVLLAAWLQYSRNENHRRFVAEKQAVAVEHSAHVVEHELSLLASDTQFMARLVERYLNSGGQLERGELALVFQDFAFSRSFYFILRYLDSQGHERVRVDRAFAGPTVSPQAALQDKSNRYYFRKSMEADKNEVYISNFDLNIEHGQIEKPYRPTIRFGCPVFDESGRKRGVVVLNYNGRVLLEELKGRAHSGVGIPMLCNGDGHWMLGPGSDQEWGHVLEEVDGASMETRFPDAWQHMSTSLKGQVETAEGLFSYETVSIIPNKVFSEDPPTEKESRNRWRIVTWVPADQLQLAWGRLYLSLLILFLALLAAGCWQFVDGRMRRQEFRALLHENEERVLAISQAARDATIMVDQDDVINHWNPAAERLFGYTADEVVGLRLHELLAPEEDRARAREGMRRFASTGHGPVFEAMVEFEGVRKDGGVVPVEMAISPFRFKKKWYAVGSARDISSRKAEEEKLRRREATSRALINATPDCALLIEPHGTIAAVNEIGASRFGLEVSEVVGRNAFEFLVPGNGHDPRNIIQQVLRTGEPVWNEIDHGDRVELMYVYPVKGSDETVVELAVFCRDVTEQRQAEMALIRSEQRFRDISESIGEFLWETDELGYFTFFTDDVTPVLGYTVDELLGSNSHTMVHPDDVDEYRAWQDRVIEKRQSFKNIEIRNLTKNGEVIWLQVSGAPFVDERGVFRGFRGAAMNITDRKRTEEAVKLNERKLRALAESAYDAIVMIDARSNVTFWNHAAEQLFGYTEAEALGKDVNTLIVPEEERGPGVFGLDDGVPLGGGVVRTSHETVGLRKDGSRVPVERSITSFMVGGEWCAVGTIKDIAERKATEAKLRELATTDSLTGLYNRRRFMELAKGEFARSLRYGGQLALLMLDIDFFKNVNDSHGHSVGDEVLRALAETAILALRNADVIGRVGGEEFAVLLPETGGESAREVAERLRLSVENAVISTAAGPLSVTISIGVSTLGPQSKSVEALLKEADDALYKAKQSGRNRVVVA